MKSPTCIVGGEFINVGGRREPLQEMEAFK
jgi:hypothetical protein